MEAFLREQNSLELNVSSSNAMTNDSRLGNTSVNPWKRNEEVAKVEVTVLVLVLLLALTGNLCVLLDITTSKHRQSRMYYFMKHLSIADLVVAIFQILPQLIWDITFRFYGPDLLCRLVKYLQIVGMFASTYMLVLMSIDRCLAICQPLRSVHRRKDRFYVVASWTLSLIFSTPQAYIFSLKEVDNDVAFIIAMLLASLNSCCNPWIYMFFAGHLFHNLMQCFFCCCRQYLPASPCSCDQQCRHKSKSSTCVFKNTSSQRSLTHTSSTGGLGH
ncbi:Isotocin receptor [Liparis tanakae]|uniref:Isotocin receptor n=1 Tax=Liparis tanakae TaxID=230148 RepID=A0A4Z2J3Y3_9TELE|nr:Isotocin receptor [Liparis tanakae]